MLFLIPQSLLSVTSEPPVEAEIERFMDKGKTAFFRGNRLEAIKYFLKASKIADEKKKYKYQCLARYSIGVCYFLAADHGEALSYYYEAYKICKKNHLDHDSENKIVHGLVGVYFEQEDYRQAYDFMLPYYRQSCRLKDSSAQSMFATDLAMICNKLARFKEADRYISEAKWFQKDRAMDYAHCLAIEAETKFLQKRYVEAERVCRRILSTHASAASDKGIALIYLINIYIAQNKYDSAFSFAADARRLNEMRNLPYFFDTMSLLYQRTGQLQQALDCKDSARMFNDSIVSMSNRQLLENSKTKLEVLRFTTDMEEEMDNIRRRHYILMALLGLSVVFVIMAIFVIRSQRAKARQQNQIIKLQTEKQDHERQMAEEQMKSLEMEARYRQEMMKQSLEQKQRELSATTMFVSSRNELIESLLNYINNETELKSVPGVKTLILHLRQLLKGKNDNDHFLVNFEAANPDFTQRLRSLHPDLLSSDFRFLAYVRMNLQIKEIASLLNINPESCRRRKIRISKKLGLQSSAELYNYVQTL